MFSSRLHRSINRSIDRSTTFRLVCLMGLVHLAAPSVATTNLWSSDYIRQTLRQPLYLTLLTVLGSDESPSEIALADKRAYRDHLRPPRFWAPPKDTHSLSNPLPTTTASPREYENDKQYVRTGLINADIRWGI